MAGNGRPAVTAGLGGQLVFDINMKALAADDRARSAVARRAAAMTRERAD
jgi:hypothetical protein